MAYLKKSIEDLSKSGYPSIHVTGSVQGMKKLGFWGKHDKVVRQGSYYYNLSIYKR